MDCPQCGWPMARRWRGNGLYAECDGCGVQQFVLERGEAGDGESVPTAAEAMRASRARGLFEGESDAD